MKKIKIKNKKLVIIGGILFLLVLISLIVMGLFFKKGNPLKFTNEYLKAYQQLDERIISRIRYPYNDKLTKKQKEFYNSIMKRQYENLEYKIVDEKISEYDAIITVKFSVYDYASAVSRANNYVEVFPDKFERNGKFNKYLAIDYKLEELNTYDERVEYSIDFYYYLDDGRWVMTDLSDTDLLKLDGNY